VWRLNLQSDVFEVVFSPLGTQPRQSRHAYRLAHRAARIGTGEIILCESAATLPARKIDFVL
jgi:hypothetical protein